MPRSASWARRNAFSASANFPFMKYTSPSESSEFGCCAGKLSILCEIGFRFRQLSLIPVRVAEFIECLRILRLLGEDLFVIAAGQRKFAGAEFEFAEIRRAAWDRRRALSA